MSLYVAKRTDDSLTNTADERILVKHEDALKQFLQPPPKEVVNGGVMAHEPEVAKAAPAVDHNLLRPEPEPEPDQLPDLLFRGEEEPPQEAEERINRNLDLGNQLEESPLRVSSNPGKLGASTKAFKFYMYEAEFAKYGTHYNVFHHCLCSVVAHICHVAFAMQGHCPSGMIKFGKSSRHTLLGRTTLPKPRSSFLALTLPAPPTGPTTHTIRPASILSR